MSNTLGTPEVVKVQINDSRANLLREHEITISPHGTKILNLEELRSASTSDGGIRVIYPGPENAVIVNGGLKDENTGYSATMPFGVAPASSSAIIDHDYAELGLMTGAADPMLSFPPETVFTPYSIVRNISDVPASVTPTIWWMEAGSARSVLLKPISLLPHQSANRIWGTARGDIGEQLEVYRILEHRQWRRYDGNALESRRRGPGVCL